MHEDSLNDYSTLTPRPADRINELLELVAADWKRSGNDQRFFQYLANLQHDLDLPKDPYDVEDSSLIALLRERTAQD